MDNDKDFVLNGNMLRMGDEVVLIPYDDAKDKTERVFDANEVLTNFDPIFDGMTFKEIMVEGVTYNSRMLPESIDELAGKHVKYKKKSIYTSDFPTQWTVAKLDNSVMPCNTGALRLRADTMIDEEKDAPSTTSIYDHEIDEFKCKILAVGPEELEGKVVSYEELRNSIYRS